MRTQDRSVLWLWFRGIAPFWGLAMSWLGGCPCTDCDEDGWTTEEGDCDDEDPQINPYADEVCDEVDNDCDGQIDEAGGITWYQDLDGDAFGQDASTLETCSQVPGYAAVGGDCDDQTPAVNPGAAEYCDGIDNNCNGLIDADDTPTTWLPDLDADGFGGGTGVEASCMTDPAYLRVRGDCDDSDPLIHPGADDAGGDGIDQDCGGTDAAEPHVGLSSDSLPSIQQALDAAGPGVTVWVGPGVWMESRVSFHGQAMTLRATHFAAATLVAALEQGPVMVFVEGEGADTLLDGFTLTRGLASAGGGLYITASSPTVRECVVTGNQAYSNERGGDGALGGGAYLVDSYAVFDGCTFTENEASAEAYSPIAAGGGLYLERSPVTFLDCTVAGNKAAAYTSDGEARGGGLLLSASDAVFEGCTISSNEAYGSGYCGPDPCSTYAAAKGGGMYVTGSHPTLTDCALRSNEIRASANSDMSANATHQYGGGLYLDGTDIVLDNCRVNDNVSVGYAAADGGYWYPATTTYAHGGGIYAYDSRVTASHTELEGNTTDAEGLNGSASSIGAGIYLEGSTASLTASALRGNSSAGASSSYVTEAGGLFVSDSTATLSQTVLVDNQGGGMYLEDAASAAEVLNSVLAYNSEYNLYLAASGPTAQVSSSDLYNPANLGINHNLPSLDATNLELEPGFLSYTGEGLPSDLHLSLASPLVDRGSSLELDLDGTVSDMGAFGGPSGGGWDRDGDGLYDYFWPGTLEDAPEGFDPAEYDAEDGGW